MEAHTVTDIEFQPASIDIWDAKYRLAAKDGSKIDATIDDTTWEFKLQPGAVRLKNKIRRKLSGR